MVEIDNIEGLNDIDKVVKLCRCVKRQTNDVFIEDLMTSISTSLNVALTNIKKQLSSPQKIAALESSLIEYPQNEEISNECEKNESIDYKYFPSNKQELKSILGQLITERGNEGDFNDIFTGDVEDFSCLFQGRSKFNGNISKWDVSNGVDFHNMFLNTPSFNGDLSNWNIKLNANVSGMFAKSGDNVKKPSVCVNI